jgi:hypothetical protein
MTTKDGFKITYNNYVVTVTRPANDNFDGALRVAHSLLNYFKATRPGSTWGCDGVGYGIQKRIGLVRVNKSGVGPKNFEKGLTAIRERNNSKE